MLPWTFPITPPQGRLARAATGLPAFVAYLDRANVGCEAEDGERRSSRVFGLGMGIFFLGYLIWKFRRVARRAWSAQMVRAFSSWGFVSALRRSCDSDAVLRRAVSAGRGGSGILPGVIVYFTHWFASGIARALSVSSGVPFSLALGSQVSALLRVTKTGRPAGNGCSSGRPARGCARRRDAVDDRPARPEMATPEERDHLEGVLAAVRAESTGA